MLRLAPSHENRLTGKLATVGKVEIVEGEEKEEVEAGEEKGMGKVAEMEEANLEAADLAAADSAAAD